MDSTGRCGEAPPAAAKSRVLTIRNHQARLLVAVFATVVGARLASAANFVVPTLNDPVTDVPGLVSPEAKLQLDQGLRRLRDSGGSQIAVLIVDNLGGESIEQASIAVTNQWKLGTQKGDNGVLLLVARREREVRIEVGQGLEGALTDAYSRRIIADIITPSFRSGDYTGGILAAVGSIVGYTDPDFKLGLGQRGASAGSSQEDENGKAPSLSALLLLIFFPLFYFMTRFGRRRSGVWIGGGPGGGSFPGGGGGGFSGGGGGFSGGGSSGKW